MSLQYSSSAFYGTFVPRGSPEGAALAPFIEHDRPGKTSDPDILIDEVGSAVTGETWIVARHRIKHRASRDDRIEAPTRLEVPASFDERLSRWLREQGIETWPPIGWYFAGSCL